VAERNDRWADQLRGVHSDHRALQSHQIWETARMIDAAQYFVLKNRLLKAGYVDEIRWSVRVTVPKGPQDFALEHAYVVCNSGMKAQIARPIFERVKVALLDGHPAWSAPFHHKGKTVAIDTVWDRRAEYFKNWQAWVSDAPLDEQLRWLQKLPWIGEITAYHLAKNLGVDCCKPDRHLVRIAEANNTEPFTLCQILSDQSGDRVATVDTVLWRCANLGWL
jgi:hypothetical protein